MTIDRLDALLQRFSVTAQMFHCGPLCGITDFPARGDCGQLHLVKVGAVEVQHGGRGRERVSMPSIVFFPRPLRHRFITDDAAGADMACANVMFNAGAINPIAQALPALIVMPLSALENAGSILDSLFSEACARHCGRHHIVNRLFEVVTILVLRSLLNRKPVDAGVLGGLAHPQVARALNAIHSAPESAWTLDKLARRAGMSRSHFAEIFHTHTGSTPAEYLARFRICIAQDLLRKGSSLKSVATQVGYSGPAALSRAFSVNVRLFAA